MPNLRLEMLGGTGSGPFRFAHAIASEMAMVHALDFGAVAKYVHV